MGAVFKQFSSKGPVSRLLIPIYAEREQYMKAYRQYEVLERLYPQHLGTAIQMGLFLMLSKKYQQAVRRFIWILKRDPRLDKARFYLATAYEHLNETESAVAHLQKIPDSSSHYVAARLRIAEWHNKQGRMQEALASLHTAMQKHPLEPRFYTFLCHDTFQCRAGAPCPSSSVAG